MIMQCPARRLQPGDVLLYGIVGPEMVEKVEKRGSMCMVDFVRLDSAFRSSFICSGNANFYIERNE